MLAEEKGILNIEDFRFKEFDSTEATYTDDEIYKSSDLCVLTSEKEVTISISNNSKVKVLFKGIIKEPMYIPSCATPYTIFYVKGTVNSKNLILNQDEVNKLVRNTYYSKNYKFIVKDGHLCV